MRRVCYIAVTQVFFCLVPLTAKAVSFDPFGSLAIWREGPRCGPSPHMRETAPKEPKQPQPPSGARQKWQSVSGAATIPRTRFLSSAAAPIL